MKGGARPTRSPGSVILEEHDLGNAFLVATTFRTGGVSRGAGESLNLSFHTGDDEEAVRENRRRVARRLGIDPGSFTCGCQVHASRIREVRSEDRGRGAVGPDSFPGTDGLVTRVLDTPLLVFGADCPGIALVDPPGKAVGVAHSGGRGTFANIAGRLVATLTDAFGSEPGHLRAYLSAAIGPCCYEIGREVIERGADVKGLASNLGEHDGRFRLDLRGLIRSQLEEAGVPSSSIAASPDCTRCSSDLYFSYRARGSRTGSCATIAMVRG